MTAPLIVVTGPESSGKSTLARELAAQLGYGLVLEQARLYLDEFGLGYGPKDLLHIAQRQQAAEQATRAAGPTVADTDLQTLVIWWQERFGPAPTSLVNAYHAQSTRVYLLCTPDLPWQADPQREHPLDRERLFELYEADLRQRKLPFARVAGQGSARTQHALNALQELSGQRLSQPDTTP